MGKSTIWAGPRICLGCIWLADGILEWHPAVFASFPQMIANAAMDQPAPLRTIILAGHDLVALDPTLANALLAGAESAVGLALIINVLVRSALMLSLTLAGAIWIWGQGLGMLFMPTTTDVQSGPLYMLLSITLLKALPKASVSPRVSPFALNRRRS